MAGKASEYFIVKELRNHPDLMQYCLILLEASKTTTELISSDERFDAGLMVELDEKKEDYFFTCYVRLINAGMELKHAHAALAEYREAGK